MEGRAENTVKNSVELPVPESETLHRERGEFTLESSRCQSYMVHQKRKTCRVI